MLTKADRHRVAVNLWTARIIPLVLAGIVGYATFVLVDPLSVNYLLVKHNNKAAAVPILVVYFVLFILMTVSFLRLLYVTVLDPPYVPLGPAALRNYEAHREKGRAGAEEDGIAMGEYNPRGTSTETSGFDKDPDSPGLELFYTKDVFVSEMDGRPIYCSRCCNWKPDRAHHDSSSGRCIRKMDHFCPWVGGPVGESNFKFFIQFNGYTALYCLHLLVVMAIYVHKQNTTEGENVNRHFCAILGLATFFGLFTAGMTGTSLELAAKNLTQVERLGGKSKVHILAVLKPPPEHIHWKTATTSPGLSFREITYPLDAGFQLNNYTPNLISDTGVNGIPQTPQAIEENHVLQVSNGLIDPHPTQPLSATGTGEPSTHPLKQTEAAQDAVPRAMNLVQDSITLAQNFEIPISGEPLITPPTKMLQAAQGTVSSAESTSQQPTMSTRGTARPTETLSTRDLSAIRTFAILKMLRPGDNPWDLGSARLNLETVMGTSIFDWLLPIRRSPCCNHESSESQFRVGPSVDSLRVSYNFTEPNGIRVPKGSGKKSALYKEENSSQSDRP